MPASLAPITPELLADFRAGKESALEQLFRSNFNALTTEAVATLDDAAAAQKVVASSFLEVWDRRGKVQSAGELETLLRQVLDSGLTHEQRRRATLHRMADTDGDHKQHATAKHQHEPESTDQVWAHIVGELHREKTDPRMRAREMTEHHRHASAAHMAQIAKPSGSKYKILGGIVLAAIVAVPLWYLNRGAETTKAEQALAREDTRPMKAAAGQRGTVKLEDSTVVSLGSASVVKLTAHFPQDFRAAQVNGTASFSAPTGDEPLLLQVGSAWVFAQDADFAVRHFADDSHAMFKVNRGTVRVRAGQEDRTLEAGATLQVDNQGVISDLPAERAAEAFSWMDGNFVMQNQPLSEVLVAIKRWYGVDIVVKDSSIAHRPVTMTATLESSKAAIAALEQSAGVKIAFEGLAMVVNDTAATPKRRRR